MAKFWNLVKNYWKVWVRFQRYLDGVKSYLTWESFLIKKFLSYTITILWIEFNIIAFWRKQRIFEFYLKHWETMTKIWKLLSVFRKTNIGVSRNFLSSNYSNNIELNSILSAHERKRTSSPWRTNDALLSFQTIVSVIVYFPVKDYLKPKNYWSMKRLSFPQISKSFKLNKISSYREDEVCSLRERKRFTFDTSIFWRDRKWRLDSM